MRLESTRVRVTDLTKLGVSAHIRQNNEHGKGSQNVRSCVTVNCDIILLDILTIPYNSESISFSHNDTKN